MFAPNYALRNSLFKRTNNLIITDDYRLCLAALFDSKSGGPLEVVDQEFPEHGETHIQ